MRGMLLFAVVTASVLPGCDTAANDTSEVRQLFAEGQIGISPDYAVIKWGNVEDHVATAHGFADDRAACREIADALNANACSETDGQGCKNPFSCVALSK